MNEELIDKYLNQSLNSEEEQKFISLLKDDEFGKFLVRYCVEVHGYHATAAKMLEDDLAKNKNEWLDLEKRDSGKWSLVALVAAAALLAVSLILILPQEESFMSSQTSLKIERNGSKILSKSFLEGDIINSTSDVPISLHDGSTISLQGKMKVATYNQTKVFILQSGGAEFKVAKQKEGSLKVVCNKTSVEVVGTQFSVFREDSETSVSVTEGTVKFSNNTQSIMLSKGDKAFEKNGVITVEFKDGIRTVEKAVDENLIFHMNFDGEDPLEKKGLSGTAVLRKGQFSEGLLAGSKALDNGMIEILGSHEDNFRIPMTINAWVKVNKETFYGPIITKGDRTWRMQLSEDGMHYHGGYGITEMDEYFNSNVRLKKGTWQMLTLVYSDKLASMYIDGEFDNRKSTELMHLNSSAPVQIGGNAEMPERFFDGLIDEVSIYDRALSEEEILLLYRRMIK